MQLGKLLEECYVSCGLQVLRRKATGGSTTTVIDTGIVNRKGENYYAQGANGGHILIISQTTDRAAPEGQFGEVSAFSTPTTTPTFTIPTVSATVQSGDIYAVCKPVIQLYEMIGRINEGLRRITQTELTDTTLTGAASTLSYSLPLPISRQKITKIEIGNNTDGWEDAPGYTIVPSTGGTTDKLLFTSQPPYDSTTAANKTFKITYLYSHPVLSTYSDYVEKSLSDDLVIKVCTEAAWEMMMNKRPAWFNDKSKLGMWQNIQQRARVAIVEHAVRNKPADRPNRFNLGEL